MLAASAAVWLAAQVAGSVWYAPVIVAAGKALRDRFPGKLEQWLPI